MNTKLAGVRRFLSSRITATAVFCLLAAIGVTLRFWYAFSVPQPTVFDQEEYLRFGRYLTTTPWYVELYHVYGYPLLLAPLFSLEPFIREPLWIYLNAYLDTATALLVYRIARRLGEGHRHGTAWAAVSGLAYLANPFSAGYVSSILTEVPAMFFVALTGYVLLAVSRRRHPAALAAAGFLAGFVPQIRPNLLLPAMGAAGILAVWGMRGTHSRPGGIARAAAVGILFCLPFLPTVIGNWRTFGIPCPTSPANAFVRELYLGIATTDRALPDKPLTRETLTTMSDFLTYSVSLPQLRETEARYAKKSIAAIRDNPRWFLSTRWDKARYVWEKHYVYPYFLGPTASPGFVAATYWTNMVLLAFAVAGIMWCIRSGTNRWFGWMTLAFMGYLTLLHSLLTTSEERYTLPVYPLLFAFAGLGASRVVRSVASRIGRRPTAR